MLPYSATCNNYLINNNTIFCLELSSSFNVAFEFYPKRLTIFWKPLLNDENMPSSLGGPFGGLY